jgi:DnaK suppressor protein
VSKTPAKKAPATKAPVKKAAPAAKPTAKAPGVPVKTAAKPIAKTAAKPATKTAVKSTPKPVAKAVSAVPPLKSASKTPPAKAAPAPAPVVAVKPPAPVAPVKPPRVVQPKISAAARASALASTPAPVPPPTSRFADRFAPPRPPTRQMNSILVDAPKNDFKPDPKLANAWKTKAGRDMAEAEVLAMPDSEYMNDKQLEFFKGRLQALKDDLLNNAGQTTEHLREDTSIVPDPADRATIEEEHALELRTRDRERKLLKKISQSLGRIESGEYGFCDETGEPIGLGRLIARPTATLSLEAQQRRELKQKMFGD